MNESLGTWSAKPNPEIVNGAGEFPRDVGHRRARRWETGKPRRGDLSTLKKERSLPHNYANGKDPGKIRRPSMNNLTEEAE